MVAVEKASAEKAGPYEEEGVVLLAVETYEGEDADVDRQQGCDQLHQRVKLAISLPGGTPRAEKCDGQQRKRRHIADLPSSGGRIRRHCSDTERPDGGEDSRDHQQHQADQTLLVYGGRRCRQHPGFLLAVSLAMPKRLRMGGTN